jgi:hypothetical protein
MSVISDDNSAAAPSRASGLTPNRSLSSSALPGVGPSSAQFGANTNGDSGDIILDRRRTARSTASSSNVSGDTGERERSNVNKAANGSLHSKSSLGSSASGAFSASAVSFDDDDDGDDDGGGGGENSLKAFDSSSLYLSSSSSSSSLSSSSRKPRAKEWGAEAESSSRLDQRGSTSVDAARRSKTLPVEPMPSAKDEMNMNAGDARPSTPRYKKLKFELNEQDDDSPGIESPPVRRKSLLIPTAVCV